MPTRTVRFQGDGVELAGELLLPTGIPPFPAVVLLHGAGWGDRKFYQVFAERFAEEGIASLIFDRRGHGGSSGPRDMDLFALGRDAAEAWRFLAGQPEIDGERVGLWGYSNGAWVGSLAAQELPELAFLLLSGASGVTPGRAEAYRRADDLRSQGIGEETVAAVERAWTLIFGYIATGARDDHPGDELARLAEIIQADAALDRLPVPAFVRERPELDSVPHFDRPPLNGPLDAMAGSSPDMAYDPITVLLGLSCPTLVVLAENDANVAPVESLAQFKMLARARSGVQVEVLSGANHMFSAVPAFERDNAELLQRSMRRDEFDPRYLDLMTGWLATTVRA